MNLIFRLLSVLLTAYFKPALAVEKPTNALRLRVLPNDLDINLHMNNGRYLTLCDLTRVDMFIRTGLAKTMWQQGWMPVIAEHTMTYKKALRPLQKYQLQMEVTGWDERHFFMTHRFVIGDRIMAEGTSRGVIVGKQGVIPPIEVMKEVNRRRELHNR